MRRYAVFETEVAAMSRCVIGIDAGTTCTKALVVDELSTVLSQGSHGYGLISSGCCIDSRSKAEVLRPEQEIPEWRLGSGNFHSTPKAQEVGRA